MNKYSIIVPIYNVDLYLEECIESILRQTYQLFELILVDDGSTDRCPEICDNYQTLDNRILVIHKPNGGLVSARKAGISIASGDYAICVDSDDWIALNYLSVINDIIEKHNPDIVCFDYIEVTADGEHERRNSYRKGYYSRENLLQEVFPSLIHTEEGASFPPAIWAKVYRMDLYKAEQLAVEDGIKIGEDVACTIPCIAKAESLFNLDRSLYYYRRNDISMTKNRKPFRWDGPELIYLHHKSRLDKLDTDFMPQIERRTIHALLNVVKTQFYRKESYSTLSREIREHLELPIYRSALTKGMFKKGTAMSFFQFCLRNKILGPIFLLSKIR